AARVLRPGSSAQTDTVIGQVVESRDSLAGRLGFEPDARGIAYALRDRVGLTEALKIANEDESWRFGQLYSLMWPSGSVARSSALSTYNRYASHLPPERLLVASRLGDSRA